MEMRIAMEEEVQLVLPLSTGELPGTNLRSSQLTAQMRAFLWEAVLTAPHMVKNFISL
jgi:hypothetical protein